MSSPLASEMFGNLAHDPAHVRNLKFEQVAAIAGRIWKIGLSNFSIFLILLLLLFRVIFGR